MKIGDLLKDKTFQPLLNKIKKEEKRSCKNKTPYQTFEFAKIGLKSFLMKIHLKHFPDKNPTLKWSIYRCRKCLFWHFGHTSRTNGKGIYKKEILILEELMKNEYKKNTNYDPYSDEKILDFETKDIYYASRNLGFE